MPRFAATAAAQYGAITRRQLVAACVPPRTIDDRVRAGKLARFEPGTYLIPGSDPSWERDVMAAVLAVGPLAAASHLTAAALLRIGPQTCPVHVTTRHGTDDGRQRTFVVHRARTFTPDDIVIVKRIPVTCPQRTLVDLAGVLVFHSLRLRSMPHC